MADPFLFFMGLSCKGVAQEIECREIECKEEYWWCYDPRFPLWPEMSGLPCTVEGWLGAVHDDFAIKFFLSRTAFHNEASQYEGNNPLRSFLPQVRNVESNERGMHVDPAGYPLPPCIVMERGESLDIWSDRNAPDPSQSFSVMYQLAERLIELHAAGIVHRDLKPGNVMWLQSQNRWTVIDFGCAAKAGSNERLAFTLRYAAPEVIAAHRGRHAPGVPATGAAAGAAAGGAAAAAPVAASAAAAAADDCGGATRGGTAGSVTGDVTAADMTPPSGAFSEDGAGSDGSSTHVDFYVTSSSATHVFGFKDGVDHLMKDGPATAGCEGGSSGVEGGKPNDSNPTSNGAASSEPSPRESGRGRQSGGQRRVVVAESIDAWSLGVMAFEMATGAPGCAFPRGMTPDEIMDEIEGVNGSELPWEGSRLTKTVRKQLQLFQGSILRLLDRDPSKRPSMREFHRICRNILGDV